MQLDVPKNPIDANIQLHAPERFSDEFGPISFDLGKKYVLYCADHRKIAGDREKLVAYWRAAKPQHWCSGCKPLVEEHQARLKAIKDAKDAGIWEKEDRWLVPEEKIIEDDEWRECVRIAAVIGSTPFAVRRNRKDRRERLERIEAARALAEEIYAERVARGEVLPRWKTGRIYG